MLPGRYFVLTPLLVNFLFVLLSQSPSSLNEYAGLLSLLSYVMHCKLYQEDAKL